MKNPITQFFEYGYYGYNVFELPMQTTNVTLLPKINVNSSVDTTFNVGSKGVMVDIDINTGEYYKMPANEGDYANLLDFIKVNQVGRIPQISPIAKVLLHYSILTPDGATVDSGIRISEVSMTDCVMTMPILDSIVAPYRVAKHIATNFTIDRFNTSGGCIPRSQRQLYPMYGHGCHDLNQTKFILYIHSIRVFGSEVGNERTIPRSMNGGNYSVGSQTILDIERDSVELFSSVWYDLGFNPQGIPGYAMSIDIPIEVVTPMIVTTDPSEIDQLLASNADTFYPGEEPGEICVDMFKPLIQRPHCPGTLPHDYFKYWDHKRPTTTPPGHHGTGSCVKPVQPGPEWPNHGRPIKIDPDKIDHMTPPGVYTRNGVLKYRWKDLLDCGAIIETNKNDTATITTPGTIVTTADKKCGNKRIAPDELGPILIIPPSKIVRNIVIGESAFFGYENLEKVYLPIGVRRIDNHAFYGCRKLEVVYAFGPDNLDGIHEIRDNAFMNCSNLRYVRTTIGLESIGERAFYHCSLLKLVVPPSVYSIGENAFHEMFRVICSPKTDLANSGIDSKDVQFFAEGDPYYNPDDYLEPDDPENPDDGNTDDNTPGDDTTGDGNDGEEDGSNEGDGSNGGDSDNTGSGEELPDNPGSTPETPDEGEPGDNPGGDNSGDSGKEDGDGEPDIGSGETGGETGGDENPKLPDIGEGEVDPFG